MADDRVPTGEPADILPGSSGEYHRYLGRFASVEVRGLLCLPSSAARDFAVAYAMGWSQPPGNERRKLRYGEVGVASLINERRRALIMDALGIQGRFWRKRVDQWIECKLAHRCKKGVVALFPRAEPACPLCGELTPLSNPFLATVLSNPTLSTKTTQIVPHRVPDRAAHAALIGTFSESEATTDDPFGASARAFRALKCAAFGHVGKRGGLVGASSCVRCYPQRRAAASA